MILFLQTSEPAEPHQNPRPLAGLRKIFSAVIVVLITLVAIELGLKFFYAIQFQQKNDLQKATQISPYAGLDWPKEFFSEESRTKQTFVPWVMWRHHEFNGKYLNISPEGLRKTWNPTGQKNQHVKKIFCFGGSTLWGMGVRDNFTIPSLLSQKLNQKSACFDLTNYGETGYTLTQEVINLMLVLKSGKIPDYVIFYDGVNEVMVGFLNQKAGSFYRANTVSLKLLSQKESVWTKLGNSFRQTNIYRAMNDIQRRAQGLFRKTPGGSPQDEAALEKLADAIVADYLENVEVVKHLAQAYGFKYLFIWQPALLANKTLTSEEKNLSAWDWYNQRFARLYQLVYDRMSRVKFDHFHNIANIFDQKQKTVFFSWAHITEEGNEKVVDRLVQIMRQESPEEFRNNPCLKAGRQ